MSRKGKRGSKKKVVLLEEKEEEPEEWDAVEWTDIEPPSDESVFPAGRADAILRDMMVKAWEDGVVTDDEMALLSTLRSALGIDDVSFRSLMEETRPPEKAVPVEDVPEDDIEIWKEAPEPPGPAVAEECGPPISPPAEDPFPREAPEAPVAGMSPPYIEDMGHVSPPPMTGSPIITLTSTIREGIRPLTASFDLGQGGGARRVRCPGCRSLVRFDSGSEKDRCPVCGSRLQDPEAGSNPLRGQLDQARNALKSGDLQLAKEILNDLMVRHPDNKEALFYYQRVMYALTLKGMGGTRPTTIDSRDLSQFSTGVPRLDQLVRGGFPVGAQVLLRGPPFCGKEVLLEHVVSSALRSGFPIIYISSTKAMKDVLRGLLRRVPDFKTFNRSGRVRLYDLFTKEADQKVMLDGHRLFHIEDQQDFTRFAEDLLVVQEGLTNEYGGGVLVLNSLSPLLMKAEPAPRQKFMQTLIARSKGYRFTNIFDIASGIHDESLMNSIELMMDGIIDFKEQDSRYSMRVRGLNQGVITRDWVEYGFSECGMDLFGSFTEERIA